MKKRLSKFLSQILIAAMIVTVFTGFSGVTSLSAAEQSVKVYVTIADGNGDLVVRQQSVEVTDVDGDDALTINDTLYCAHEKYFKGGAKEGYSSDVGTYGLCITKLWGDESGAFGYALNDVMVSTDLTEPVDEGCFLNAFIYEDKVTWSDAYTFFNKHVYGVNKGKYVTFKLSYYALDPVTYEYKKTPMANARIMINGYDNDYITNVKGIVSIPFEESGSYFISAVHPGMNIVPPSGLVFVKASKGEEITVKGLTYTVTKVGSISGKMGKVTISKASAGSKKIPKTIEYGGVTFKVKKVD